MRGFTLTAAFLALALSSLHAATTIRDDTGGIAIFRVKGHDSLDKPLVFRRLDQDQAYFDIITPANLLIHVETELMVKVVYFINPATFPTKFQPEDLDALKTKIDQLRSLGPVSPDAAKLAASQLQYLQNVYDVESVRYKQSAEIAAQKFASDQEKADFDKKCELLWLQLQASSGDLKHSEEVVKEMEPLAARSDMLTGVLAKWNQEKNRALQLSGECKDLWQSALKTNPANFKPAGDLKQIPDFPPDVKEKIAALQDQLDQFRSSVTIPQTALYCKNEIPAVFLLNELPKLVEKIKAQEYKDAAGIGQKALQQLRPEQFVDPYTPVYDTFKNYTDLVDDLRTRFFHQLAKARDAEGNVTNREALAEYQKAYDIIPDTDVAEKIEQLKQKIKEQ